MSDVVCPYCGEGQEIYHDDCQAYEEDIIHSQECDHCRNTFVFKTYISTNYYDVGCADCLNDGYHDYESTFTNPVKYTMMECNTCGHTRDPTPSEMAQVLKERGFMSD